MYFLNFNNGLSVVVTFLCDLVGNLFLRLLICTIGKVSLFVFATATPNVKTRRLLAEANS